ncbi:MAG: hypothetical protein IJ506_00875 [Clostridia bacterium]|nr:hypothetical protein [Clostridia bacterium]
MITEQGTVIKINSNDCAGNVRLTVSSAKTIKSLRFHVEEQGTERKWDFSYAVGGGEFTADMKLENPKLWSVYAPSLYAYTLETENADGVETANGTFGIRSISTQGKNVCLNGEPIFIRGYIRGEKCHDHINTCNLPEAEFYRKNIRQAKRYGFNFIRFHSTIPSELFFQVADEEGILIHMEMRDPNAAYNNQEEMLKARNEFVSDEFLKRLVDSLYNHPSLAVYCIGNEIKWLEDNERVKEIGRLIKSIDDTRLFIDTAAWGAHGRDNVDIDVQHMSYYFPFGKHSDMYENTDNLLVCGCADGSETEREGVNSVATKSFTFDVPLLAHEVCHYVALSDFKKLKEKFKNYKTAEPWWIDEELKLIEAKGMTDRYEDMYKASKLFQYECWKTAFEKMRMSRLIGGFHCLQFADTHLYENSNGIVDCFDEENYVTAEAFQKFNGDEVLLADINERIYVSEGVWTVPFLLSNYGQKKDEFADFEYAFAGTSGKVYASGKLHAIPVKKKGSYAICKIKIFLPKLEIPEKCVLTASLKNENGVFAENQWKVWLYPKREEGSYSDFCNYRKGDVAITDDIDAALRLLKEGKKVCLVYRSAWTRHLLDKKMPNPKYAFNATWNRFKPVIWDRGTNCGGLCDEVLLNEFGFTTDAYYDFNYAKITEDCDKINLDDFPAKVRSLISGSDKCARDRFDPDKEYFNLSELQYEYTLRDFSYLFELKIGEGSLLVCGLNLTGLDENEPSTVAMARFIKGYLHSQKFRPVNGLSEEAFVAYLKKKAEKPVKERMMTQFWELDNAPVESLEYWLGAKAYLTEE